jgi:hypothetical protein
MPTNYEQVKPGVRRARGERVEEADSMAPFLQEQLDKVGDKAVALLLALILNRLGMLAKRGG